MSNSVSKEDLEEVPPVPRVVAKFACTEVAYQQQGGRVTLMPVTGGSKENEDFFKWTPAGSIEMGLLVPEALEHFQPGAEYYVEFTPVNAGAGA